MRRPFIFPIPFLARLAVSIAIALSSVACKKPTPRPEAPIAQQMPDTKAVPPPLEVPPHPNFPVNRKIEDKSGRKLDVIIVGRSSTEVFITRRSDWFEFRIPITNLSQADQDYVLNIPPLTPPSGFANNTFEKEEKSEPPFIKTRLETIERLNKANEKLALEMEGVTNKIVIRSRQAQIQENNMEIARLRGDIERFRPPPQGK